jgi:uncharacterized membrane protein
MARRKRDPRLIVALALVTLVAGHNLVLLATYGTSSYASALARTGHGLAWTLAVVSTAAIGTVLAGLGAERVWSLSRRARLLGGRGDLRLEGVAALGRDLIWLWLALLVAGLAAFVAIENLERLAAGQPLPGLAAMGGTALSPIEVFVAVSGVIAFVVALYGWRTAQLIAEIVARLRQWRRPVDVLPRRFADVDRRLASAIGGRLAGRAPPRLAFGLLLLA